MGGGFVIRRSSRHGIEKAAISWEALREHIT
jgi:hypothetical protein